MPTDLENLDQQAAAVIKDIGIPPCPAIIVKIHKESRSGDPDLPKICNLISTDLSLAGSVLATVNSAFYGLRTKARSIDAAVMLLGIRNVATLVTGLMLKQAFPINKNPALQQFWDKSARIAAISAYLAEETRAVPRDTAYTFGLFRDAGMLAMAGTFPDYVREILPAAQQGSAALLGAERQRYAFQHAEVGFELGKAWQLPTEMALAIQHHHRYARDVAGRIGAGKEALRLTAIGYLADFVLGEAIGEPDLDWADASDFVLNLLGLSPEGQLTDLVAGAREVLQQGV